MPLAGRACRAGRVAAQLAQAEKDVKFAKKRLTAAKNSGNSAAIKAAKKALTLVRPLAPLRPLSTPPVGGVPASWRWRPLAAARVRASFVAAGRGQMAVAVSVAIADVLVFAVGVGVGVAVAGLQARSVAKETGATVERLSAKANRAKKAAAKAQAKAAGVVAGAKAAKKAAAPGAFVKAVKLTKAFKALRKAKQTVKVPPPPFKA